MRKLILLLLIYPTLLIAMPLQGLNVAESNGEPVLQQEQQAAEPLANKEFMTISHQWQKFTFWVIHKQREYHRSLSAKVEVLSQQQSFKNTGLLLLLSFLYGVFHAAGPGHGKAVLTTYLLTQPEKLRQGVQLSFLAAMLQGITAILLVTFLVHGLGWLAKEALASVAYIEMISFLLVALLGLLLAIRGIKQLIQTKKNLQLIALSNNARFFPLQNLKTKDPKQSLALHVSSTVLGSSACNSCGQVHHIAPDQLTGRNRLQNLSLVLSIGMRPCSGAVLVLVATNLLGLWWIGVLATLAMALGTALTVTTLAVLAVQARLFAKRLLNIQTHALGKLSALFVFLGGSLILLLGISLFIGSLTNSNPMDF